MNKPIVLIIDNSVAVTGALKSIVKVAYDLSTFFNFRLVVPAKSRDRLRSSTSVFLGVYELPMLELSRRVFSILLYFPLLIVNAIRLNLMIKRHRVAIIHLNDLYNLLPVAIRLLSNETPYVCHVRFLPNRFPTALLNFWIKLHFRFAERIVVVSEMVKHQLPAHPKIVVIHDPPPLEDRYPYLTPGLVPKKSYTFLYLSNFMEGKGQAFALKAFSNAHNTLPNWKLRFVGGDMGLEKNRKYRDGLKSKAVELGIDHKIEWMDFTEEVEWELKQADIILNFSESESFSITCLEALYFGRPLIASDCGGPAEIIDHMETGILVPNRDVQAMADAMILLASNADLRNSMADKARVVVKERFSVENTSLKLKEVYDTILQGSTTGQPKDSGTANL